MYKPIGGGHRIVDKSNGFPSVEGLLEALMPKGIVDVDIIERKDTHGDGSLLIVAFGDELSIGGDHLHHFALFNVVIRQ